MAALELSAALELLAQTLGGLQPSSEPKPVAIGQAVGRIAATEVVASGDHPPANQSLRDGVAYHRAPWSPELPPWPPETFPRAELPEPTASRLRVVTGTVFPGQPPAFRLASGQAAMVMTGATVPDGADHVAMIEDLEWWRLEGGRWQRLRSGSLWSDAQQATHVLLPPPARDAAPVSGHVLAQGAVYRRGQRLVSPGTRLNPVHVGLLSSAGQAQISCWRLPRVAVLTTGDELVDVGRPLHGGQIYNSNGPLLAALLQQAGIHSVVRHHAKDDRADIRSWLQEQLGNVDLIITTGAVSAGQKDQLPDCFQQLGVETVFHGVKIKPGKPIFCGRWSPPASSSDRQAIRPTLVMGLPGNPISVWVTWQIFVRQVTDRLLGTSSPSAWLPAWLDRAGDALDSRLTFWPGRLNWEPPPWSASAAGAERELSPRDPLRVGPEFEPPAAPLADDFARLWVTPLEWLGSPDLRSPVEANCLIYFAGGQQALPIGQRVSVLLLPA